MKIKFGNKRKKNYKIAYKSSNWPEMHWNMLLMEHQAVQESTCNFMLMASLYGRGRGFRGKNKEMENYLRIFLPLPIQQINFKHEFLLSISSNFQSENSKLAWEETIKLDQKILNLLQRITRAYDLPSASSPAA